MVEILNQYAGAWAIHFMGFVVLGSVFLCSRKGTENRKWAARLFLLNLMAILIFVYVVVLDFPGLR